MVKPVKTSENVAYYHNIKYSSIQQLNKNRKMHGVKRVIAFCIFIVILPATLIIIPLYLRHSIFADVIYPVAESDIIEIRDGISSIFCEKHSLHMNTSFNAFQLQSKPEISRNRKHIRLKKSMTLPDDTLEYWGFYLLKGAIVELKVCSRYEGSRILLVKGDRNLNTCGLLEHNKNKVGTHFAHGYDKVQVTLETVAEVVVSEEEKSSMNYNITHLNGRGRESKNNEEEYSNHNNFHHHHHHNKISTEEIKSGDYQSDNNYYYDDDDGGNNDENHGGEDLHEDNNDHKLSLKYGNKVLNSLKRKSDQNKKQRKFDDKRKIIHNNDDGSGRIDDVADGLLSNSNKTENVTKNIKIAEEFTQTNDSNKNNRQNLINSQKIRHRRHYNRRQQHHQQKQESKKFGNVENEKLTETEKEHIKFIKDEHERKKKEIMKQLYDKIEKNKNLQHNNNGKNEKIILDRKKRDTVYDAKIAHGGNALNFTENESNSVSSFENGLLTCYDGQILLAQSFNPSSLCTSIRYLENGTHMIAKHEVEEDGYYYYIFYSDNDLVVNDIHAVFDIYKPTYQYTNITDSKGCVNNTNCTFPINFLSDEIVVVEVPTRDGIEHEDDDITFLISTCHPRMSVYIIFPILVLVLILSCSFL